MNHIALVQKHEFHKKTQLQINVTSAVAFQIQVQKFSKKSVLFLRFFMSRKGLERRKTVRCSQFFDDRQKTSRLV